MSLTKNYQWASMFPKIIKRNKWKTIFRTKQELYKYLVLLFGLTNSLAIFIQLINNILKEYLDKFVIIYLDNILIYLNILIDHTSYIN